GNYVQTLYSGTSQTPAPFIFDLKVDAAGNVFFALSFSTSQLMEIPAGGTAMALQPTLAASGQPAQFAGIRDMATDAAGNLYFVNVTSSGSSNYTTQIFKVDPSGIATVIA